MRLRFVSAPGGSAFMHELLTVVAHEAAQALEGTKVEGVDVSEGPLVGGPHDVFVVVPHEFFQVLPEFQHPTAEVRQRTIGFCVEHPGTDTFDTTVRTASGLGACMAINDDSTSALHMAGIPTERFSVGYSTKWDTWHGEQRDRPTDVLYLGTTDARRSRFLTADAEILENYEVKMFMPPHEPMTQPRADFFMGDHKLQLLSDSRVLLNLHRATSHSFEWVRALEAICNGCVVITEHSSDLAPLRPGQHLFAAAPHRIVHLARTLLEHPDRLNSVRAEAYAFVRDEMPMRPSAATLVELAQLLPDRPLPRPTPTTSKMTRQWPSWPSGLVTPAVRSNAAFPSSFLRHSTAAAPDTGGERTTKFSGPESVDVLTVGASHISDQVAASTAEFVLLVGAGDQLFPLATHRLLDRLSNDPTIDAAYGFAITPDQAFVSALPFEPERVLRRPYLALSSMWRRTSLLEVLKECHGIDQQHPEWVNALWSAAASQQRRVGLIPRPIVRRGYEPTRADV